MKIKLKITLNLLNKIRNITFKFFLNYRSKIGMIQKIKVKEKYSLKIFKVILKVLVKLNINLQSNLTFSHLNIKKTLSNQIKALKNLYLFSSKIKNKNKTHIKVLKSFSRIKRNSILFNNLSNLIKNKEKIILKINSQKINLKSNKSNILTKEIYLMKKLIVILILMSTSQISMINLKFLWILIITLQFQFKEIVFSLLNLKRIKKVNKRNMMTNKF